MDFIISLKKYSKIWIWTILIVDVLLLVVLPIAIADSGVSDAGSLPMNLLFVFVVASIGAIFTSFVPLLLFVFFQTKFNLESKFGKTFLYHTIASALAYIFVLFAISSFNLKNYNLIYLVVIYQLIGLILLYRQRPKSIA